MIFSVVFDPGFLARRCRSSRRPTQSFSSLLSARFVSLSALDFFARPRPARAFTPRRQEKREGCLSACLDSLSCRRWPSSLFVTVACSSPLVLLVVLASSSCLARSSFVSERFPGSDSISPVAQAFSSMHVPLFFGCLFSLVSPTPSGGSVRHESSSSAQSLSREDASQEKHVSSHKRNQSLRELRIAKSNKSRSSQTSRSNQVYQ